MCVQILNRSFLDTSLLSDYLACEVVRLQEIIVLYIKGIQSACDGSLLFHPWGWAALDITLNPGLCEVWM